MKLRELKIGQSAVVGSVSGTGALRRHFLDMGLVCGVEVTLVKFAPMGDPMQINVCGYELTLRLADAELIEIEKPYRKKDNSAKIPDEPTFRSLSSLADGDYFVKRDEKPLAKGSVLNFALVGNQNCGKTTLFNLLTGSNRHVGNFPGVTVEQKSGRIKGKENAWVTDLPGIYSLSPFSEEEIVSRNFILQSKPNCIIDIVDATNIERNLYLTLQLIELNVPIVLTLNMMDEVRGNGGSVDAKAMERALGVPIIPISAGKNDGVDELVERALTVAEYRHRSGRLDFCGENRTGRTLRKYLDEISRLIKDRSDKAGIPVRFATGKLVEGDELIFNALGLDEAERERLESIVRRLEKETGSDRASAMANMRFEFIRALCEKMVVKPKESKESSRSRKIDDILTGKFTAIPFFVLIMSSVFFLTFRVIGYYLQQLLQLGIDALADVTERAFDSWQVNSIVKSLVIDGIFTGVGSVLSFVPIIVTLFFFLSMLEDSGYMARIAFVSDKLLRKIGLSGKSIVPMLIGFGCTVPGVMATRTLSSEKDRKMTIMLTPFMSCSAKLPVYSFLSSAFFGKYAWLVMISMYFIGIFIGVIFALVCKNTVFKGESVPFVMELPNYRLPGRKNVLMLMWDKTKDFLKRAFSVILVASLSIWFLQSFTFGLRLADDPSQSMLAVTAGLISPVFKPLGFGDWRIVTALISGFIAKESVVSSLEVLGGTQALLSLISPWACFSLLVFCALYTPCVAAITAIRKELGVKWALATVGLQCAIAWLTAGAVALIGLIAG